MYHYFAMINMMILTEFGHSLEIVNVHLEFLVTVYFVQKSLFVTSLQAPPPLRKKNLKRHKQTNIHYKILHINMMLLIIFQKLILQMHDYEGLV